MKLLHLGFFHNTFFYEFRVCDYDKDQRKIVLTLFLNHTSRYITQFSCRLFNVMLIKTGATHFIGVTHSLKQIELPLFTNLKQVIS